MRQGSQCRAQLRGMQVWRLSPAQLRCEVEEAQGEARVDRVGCEGCLLGAVRQREVHAGVRGCGVEVACERAAEEVLLDLIRAAGCFEEV